MFNLQGSEIIAILLLALVVLGPDKLPDAIRRFTQTYNELRKMGSGFQSELKSALDEPMREMRETADLVRDAVDPEKIAADAETEKAPAAVAGDPPLVEAPEADPSSESETPERVNRVAAANSSGAIASSREAAEPHGDESGGPVDADDESVAVGESPVASGPAFHSAATPKLVTEAVEDSLEQAPDEMIAGSNGSGLDKIAADAGGDVAPGQHSVEGSDEAATA